MSGICRLFTSRDIKTLASGIVLEAFAVVSVPVILNGLEDAEPSSIAAQNVRGLSGSNDICYFPRTSATSLILISSILTSARMRSVLRSTVGTPPEAAFRSSAARRSTRIFSANVLISYSCATL